MVLGLWHDSVVHKRYAIFQPLGGFIAASLGMGAAALHAQEEVPPEVPALVEQRVPATALLDLRGDDLDMLNPDLPFWVRAIEKIDPAGLPPKTPHGYLISLSPFPSVEGLSLSVLQVERPGAKLVVEAYNAEFLELLPTIQIDAEGEGMASRDFHLEGPGIVYLVVAASEANTLKTLLINQIKTLPLLRSGDAPVGASPLSLFSAALPVELGRDDQELFGRIRAELMSEEERLASRESITFEVDLEQVPLMAVLAFQVQGIDPSRQVKLDVNGRGPISIHYVLPDLADPRFVGYLRTGEDGMSFQYVGKMMAKAVIPARWLRLAEPNSLRLYLPEGHPEVTISDVYLELKYPWSKFTYTLD